MKTIEPISIHMIDDDEMFLRALQQHLQRALKESIKIKWFLTGEEFLKNLPTEKPDIIILDHILNSRLPYAMDGRFVLQKIRQADPEIPVIMLSGQNKIETALESIKDGAYDYVVKNDNAFMKIQTIIRNAVKNTLVSQKKQLFKHWATMIVSLLFIVSLAIIVMKTFFP
ncbi:MAG TPA: response regulator [Bacteroidia bacterium]|jgi:DNA-binding NtrC family response regulator